MTGEWISHYQVLSKLGTGGMGVVYAARDSRLGRTVALKVLPPEKSRDPKRKQRFLREARAAAALNHPNIVNIYDIGEDRGIDFIAMELVTGSSLDELMKSGLLPVADILSYASQIARAMAKAHAAGVVHRDLKPGNIMITEEGSVKLLDFGLAQLNPMLAVAEAETASVITEIGAAVGTVQYMSPEQARGEPVDERSDIFSFGVLLYEMASGFRPFQAASTFGVLQAISYNEPKPIGECRGEVPSKFCEIIARCLKKDREARYRDMDAVVAAIREITGDPTLASALYAPAFSQADAPARPGALSTRHSKRRLRVAAWGAAALAAVALAFGLSPAGRRSWHEFRASGAASSLHLPVEAAEWVRRGHGYLLRYDKAGHVDKAIECFQKALEQDRESAAAYAGLGESYAQKYAENRDPQWLRLARSNASRAIQLNDLLADAHVSLGLAQLRSDQFQDAEREFRRALELEPMNADAQLRLGESLAGQNREKDAEASYRKMFAMHPDDWRPYHFLGALSYQNARYENAIAFFQTAARLAPDNPAIYRLLGSAYQMLDRDAEAAEALQKALAIRPTPYVLSNLGTVYYFSGRYLDAASAFQRAISTGANDSVLWGNLGDAYRFTAGNDAKTREAYQQAIHLLQQQIDARPDSADPRCTMAAYLAKSGDKARAWEMVRQYQSAPKLEPDSLWQLALASELCGRREKALELLGKAVQSGLPIKRIQNDPDLLALRSDPGYHRGVLAQKQAGRK